MPDPQDVPAWDQFCWACRTAETLNPDLVMVTGDLALETGRPDIYDAVAAQLARLSADFLVIPGNHDDRSCFAAAFGRRYLLSDHHPTIDRLLEVSGRRLILLDTADYVLHAASLAWLDSVLQAHSTAASRGECSPVATIWMHHPPATGFHRFMDRDYALKNGDDFLHICRRYQDLLKIFVFCGHYHTEHQQHLEGITQFCTPSTRLQLDPTTSGMVISSTEPAIRVVDIDDFSVETAVIGPAHTSDREHTV